MNILKNILFAVVILFSVNSIFSDRPTLDQVKSSGNKAVENALSYYKKNNLSQISAKKNVLGINAGEFRDLLGGARGLLFYAQTNSQVGFDRTADTLDKYFGTAWHNIYS